MKLISYISLLYLVLALSNIANADTTVVNIDIKNHQFIPDVVLVPAGQKFYLQINNLDPSAEEFESLELHREKIVPPNSSIKLIFAPIKPGTYTFFGEFHPDSAQGKLIVQ